MTMSLALRLRKLFHILRVADYRRALWQGVAATVEHEKPLGRLAVATVLDIGANTGQFALLCRHRWPDARIFSFEPLPIAAARFARWTNGDSRTRLYTTALGTARGEVDFHVSARADSSSMLPMTGRQSAIFPGTAEIGTIRVTVDRLDALIGPADLQSPVLLKIDVQGFELAVLQGCGVVIDQVDYVYCECSFQELYHGQALADEVINWLSAHGFALRGVYNSTYDALGQAVQADFLFHRQPPELRYQGS